MMDLVRWVEVPARWLCVWREIDKVWRIYEKISLT